MTSQFGPLCCGQYYSLQKDVSFSERRFHSQNVASPSRLHGEGAYKIAQHSLRRDINWELITELVFINQK